MKTRAVSALVLAPVAIAAVCAGGGWLALPLAGLAMIGFGEFAGKARVKGIHVNQPLGAGCAALLILVCWGFTRADGAAAKLPAEPFGLVVMGLATLLVLGSLTAAIFRYHREPEAPVLADTGGTVLASLWIGLGFSFFVLLRETASLGGAGRLADGARVLLLVFFTTWSTDSGAYLVGRKFGRRKLTPASPNKTVEGSLGGLAASLLIGIIAGLALHLPLALVAAIGLLVGITSQLGDLAKSILKRDLGTKDFGDLIPGHGGVLDRCDSLLMNVPLVFYVVWLLS